MAQDAASTSDWPNYHATLTDGTTTIPIVFTDALGNKDIRAFKIDPFPRQALKTAEGDSKYSDLEPPYFAKAQDDFTGGRGNEDFENDTSRYFDGHWVDTTREDGIVLGGRETYGTGYQNTDQVMPGSVRFVSLQDSFRFIAGTFEASASYTTYQCEIWIKKVGSPGDLKVELWSYSGDDPNAMLCTKTITAANITTDVISLLKDFAWTGAGSNEDIVDGTDYWVVVDGGASATSTNHWELGTDGDTTTKVSGNGSDWTSSYAYPYFRITPAANTWDYVTFLEYKRGLYFFTRDDNADSKLYINGDRGACDANTGALSTLVDGIKSWTTNEWAGCKVGLIDQSGTQESITWRLISSNTGTALTVTPDWELVHSTADSYVIVGSDKWTYLRDLDEIRNFTVANDVVFFTRQDNGGMVRYRAYNSGGTWTEEEVNVSNDCDYVKYIKPPGDSRGYLHCVKSGAQTIFNLQQYYFKSQIPIEASSTYFLEQVVASIGSHKDYWDGKLGSNLTIRGGEASAGFTIAGAHTTGIVAVQNFDTPVDLTRGRYISFDAESDVNCDSGDFQLCVSDVEGLTQTWSPIKVLKSRYANYDKPTKVWHNDTVSSTNAFTDKKVWYDGKTNAATGNTISWADDDYVLIGYSEPFNSVNWNLHTTVNAVADSTMSVAYFNGQAFVGVAGFSDGTKTADNGTFKTLGQDGTMTWTLPEEDEWKQNTINSIEAYWILLNADKALTNSIQVLEVYVIRSGGRLPPEFLDLTRTYDGDTATDDDLTLETADYLYVGYGTKFNKVSVDVGTANDIASVLTAGYWNGSTWTAVTISDGTDSSGDTLKQNGDITFTIPEDWEANTVDGTETYWIRFDVSVALDTLFSIDEITVTFDDYYTVNLTAMVANVWEHFALILNRHLKNIDWTSIKSIGFNLTADKGANVLDVKNFQG